MNAKGLKKKYVSDWSWDDWDIYWNAINDWYYYGIEYDDGSETELTLEEEYAFEVSSLARNRNRALIQTKE